MAIIAIKDGVSSGIAATFSRNDIGFSFSLDVLLYPYNLLIK
jgi:hypothetical protein